MPSADTTSRYDRRRISYLAPLLVIYSLTLCPAFILKDWTADIPNPLYLFAGLSLATGIGFFWLQLITPTKIQIMLILLQACLLVHHFRIIFLIIAD